VAGFLILPRNKFMINDVLEQIVEDYFRGNGYFTQHNVKYRQNDKGVHSDIDVLGIHPYKKGAEKVVVISCKSWQGGLNIKSDLDALKNNPEKVVSGKLIKNMWKEFFDKNYANALQDKVCELTGGKEFIFYLAVTKYKGNKEDWENFPLFIRNYPNCKIKIIDLKTMIDEIWKFLTTTPSHSELTRLLQLIKADDGRIQYENN